jgi:ABC-type iron transport system FetAB ATPase subunit
MDKKELLKMLGVPGAALAAGLGIGNVTKDPEVVRVEVPKIVEVEKLVNATPVDNVRFTVCLNTQKSMRVPDDIARKSCERRAPQLERAVQKVLDEAKDPETLDENLRFAAQIAKGKAQRERTDRIIEAVERAKAADAAAPFSGDIR